MSNTRYEWQGLYDTIDLLDHYATNNKIASWDFSNNIDGKVSISMMFIEKKYVDEEKKSLSSTLKRQYKVFSTFRERIINAHDGVNVYVKSESEKLVHDIIINIHDVNVNDQFFKAFNYLKLNANMNKRIITHVELDFSLVKEDFECVHKLIQVLGHI
jgi:hypothetical protein